MNYNHVMGIEDDSKFTIHYLLKDAEAGEDDKSDESSDEEKDWSFISTLFSKKILNILYEFLYPRTFRQG